MKELDCLEKIDHSVCLAFNENNSVIFNKDQYEHIDCKDIYDFVECHDTVYNGLKLLETIYYVIPLEHFEYLRDTQKITDKDFENIKEFYSRMDKEIKDE